MVAACWVSRAGLLRIDQGLSKHRVFEVKMNMFIALKCSISAVTVVGSISLRLAGLLRDQRFFSAFDVAT